MVKERILTLALFSAVAQCFVPATGRKSIPPLQSEVRIFVSRVTWRTWVRSRPATLFLEWRVRDEECLTQNLWVTYFDRVVIDCHDNCFDTVHVRNFFEISECFLEISWRIHCYEKNKLKTYEIYAIVHRNDSGLLRIDVRAVKFAHLFVNRVKSRSLVGIGVPTS